MVAITYVVMSAALVVAGLLSTSVTGLSLGTPRGLGMLACAALAAVLMLRELRRDPYHLAVFWTYLGVLMGGCGFGGIALLASRTVALVVLGLVALAWIVSVVVVVRGELDESTSPLVDSFPGDQVFEQAGVQLAVRPVDPTAGGALELELFLLNAWDTERTVQAKLWVERPLGSRSDGVRVDDVEASLTLAPVAFGCWRLPVYVSTPERRSIRIELRVAGQGGQRFYKKRLRSLPARLPLGLTSVVAFIALGPGWAWVKGLAMQVPAGDRAPDPGVRERRWVPLAR